MTELQLERDGVTRVVYSPELKASVTESAALWEIFCALPQQEKDKLLTSNLFNGSGYERKIDDAVSADRKENFDLSHTGIDELLSITSLSNEARTFIESIAHLPELAAEAITEVGRGIRDPLDQIQTFQALAQQSAPNTFFRFLHYPAGATVGSIIAEPHTDHSGITLHLSESTDGCEKLNLIQKTWSPLPISEGSALAFGGMQAQLASGGEVTALSHRVIANETAAAVGRYAVVCFTPLFGYPAYDKNTHGRLQEKEPGFNYGMNLAEFQRYFVQE